MAKDNFTNTALIVLIFFFQYELVFSSTGLSHILLDENEPISENLCFFSLIHHINAPYLLLLVVFLLPIIMSKQYIMIWSIFSHQSDGFIARFS